MPISAGAQFTYVTNNGTIMITGYTGPGGVVVIPESITGLPVTVIGNAFSGRFNLNSVIIPNSVLGIAANAFAQCRGLTNVTFSTNLTDVSRSAFQGCDALVSLILPDSLIRLGDLAFNGCAGLTNLSIGANVTTIGADAFSGCPKLSEVSLSSNVSSIGSAAFAGCRSMSNIVVDPLNPYFSTVDGVLFNKDRTSLLEYPAGKTGDYGIPEGVTSIGYNAFRACTGVTGVTVSDSVTSIGLYAFMSCERLNRVRLGRGVRTVGLYAFGNCGVLTNIMVDPANADFSSADGVLFNKNSTAIVAFPGGIAGAYAVPEGTIAIVEAAFHSTNLTSVSIADSVRNIGDSAFNCPGLTNATIGSGVTNIGNNAFGSDRKLTAVYFRGNAPRVGSNAFRFDPAIAYYLPGTLGWGATFGGLPTAPWVLPYPVILAGSSGISDRGFGFGISWASNASVLVEVSTDLDDDLWTPVQTNALVNGSSDFSDVEWTNSPARFHRIRSL